MLHAGAADEAGGAGYEDVSFWHVGCRDMFCTRKAHSDRIWTMDGTGLRMGANGNPRSKYDSVIGASKAGIGSRLT